jgi:hypothetical protein
LNLSIGLRPANEERLKDDNAECDKKTRRHKNSPFQFWWPQHSRQNRDCGIADLFGAKVRVSRCSNPYTNDT